MADTAQDAHDSLLAAMPQGARHDPCLLCAASRDTAKEVAEVPDQRTFTETEHFALLTDAVTRETATLTAERDQLRTELAERTQRVDVLAAAQDVLTAERDKATAEFEAFKADLTAKASIAERKATRVEQVKAANDALSEEFFTAERAQRWAEMGDEAFEAVLDGIAGTKNGAKPVMQTAAFTGGESPAASTNSALGQYLRLGHPAVAAK